MYTFESDYIEGAHPLILDRLLSTNMEQLSGYGNDKYTRSAEEKILEACDLPHGSVYFLAGGTQTNQVVIDSMTRSYEGVISVVSGHINCHEAGAIEASGHKVLTLPEHNGKMDAHELAVYLHDFYADGSHSHMVYPGMVYIAHPTEYGTLYTREEVEKIRTVCDAYHLPLFLDGARLGYALGTDSDVDLKALGELCDVFYIGGTKCGALIGEAVVFARTPMPKHFATMVKRHGAMLAKGRLIASQFDVLFTDRLYEKINAHAVEQAMHIKHTLQAKGYRMLIDSPTNQQFVILSEDKIKELQDKVGFEVWEKVDDTHSAVRFVTSWATKDEAIDMLLELF